GVQRNGIFSWPIYGNASPRVARFSLGLILSTAAIITHRNCAIFSLAAAQTSSGNEFSSRTEGASSARGAGRQGGSVMCSHGGVSPCFSRTPRHSEAATIGRHAALPTVLQAVIRDRT